MAADSNLSLLQQILTGSEMAADSNLKRVHVLVCICMPREEEGDLNTLTW